MRVRECRRCDVVGRFPIWCPSCSAELLDGAEAEAAFLTDERPEVVFWRGLAAARGIDATARTARRLLRLWRDREPVQVVSDDGQTVHVLLPRETLR